LSHPVRVKDSQILDLSTDSVFSDSSVGPSRFQLGNTLIDWLPVDDTLGDGLLSASSSYSDSVDDISLLLLVAELSCFLGTRRSGTSVDDG